MRYRIIKILKGRYAEKYQVETKEPFLFSYWKCIQEWDQREQEMKNMYPLNTIQEAEKMIAKHKQDLIKPATIIIGEIF